METLKTLLTFMTLKTLMTFTALLTFMTYMTLKTLFTLKTLLSLSDFTTRISFLNLCSYPLEHCDPSPFLLGRNIKCSGHSYSNNNKWTLKTLFYFQYRNTSGSGACFKSIVDWPGGEIRQWELFLYDSRVRNDRFPKSKSSRSCHGR